MRWGDGFRFSGMEWRVAVRQAGQRAVIELVEHGLERQPGSPFPHCAKGHFLIVDATVARISTAAFISFVCRRQRRGVTTAVEPNLCAIGLGDKLFSQMQECC